jgi:dTDP-4-dehydrorhamnose 3,5-epimerase
MKTQKTSVMGAFLIELEPFLDNRGAFAEAFVQSKLSAQGLDFEVRRVNLVVTHKACTVRGMHWQADPWAQGKIVMAVSGKIFDAIVDVRPKSSTFGENYGVMLSPQVNALFIPRGVAHGCQAIEDGSTLLYLVDNEYKPAAERGITPVGAIDWPLPLVNVAPRDLSWPTLKELGAHA